MRSIGYRNCTNLCILALIFFFLPSLNAQIYVVNGNATDLGSDCFQITPAQNNQAGSVWSQNKISLASDFEIQADLNFGNKDSNGADGMAFVLQPVCTGVGSLGGGIGYQGIAPSLAVEFDTYQNAAESNDPVQDHISLQRNGVLFHAAPSMLTPGVSVLPNIENGANHPTVIQWTAATQTLRVTFDGVLQFVYTGNIVADIFGGNPEVFWGFTAATGALNNDQRVCITGVESTELTQYVITDASCAENSDGAIDFTAGPDLTFEWSNGATTEDISNLSPDVYVLSVTDANGCASTYTIEVGVALDLLPPVITCPADISISCGGDLTPDNTGEATAMDNCIGAIFGFADSSTPTGCDGGEILRTWTAVDVAGNTGVCEQKITVVADDIPPVCANCPGDVTISCGDEVPELPVIEASDNCDPAPVVTVISTTTQTGDSLCTNYAYTISRVVTVTDACGNATDYPQTITVVDDVAPVCLNCPGDVTISCGDDVPELPVIEASDNCDVAPVITAISTTTQTGDGSCGDHVYVISRVVTVTDACGNATSYPQTITIVDDVAPVCLNCPGDVTISCGDEVPELPVIEASDNCDAAPVITVVSTTTQTGDGSCGDYTYTISRVVTVTDACGNATSYPQKITVVDDVAPVCLNCPGDVTVSCDEIPELSTVEVSDNCDPAPVVTVNTTTTPGGNEPCSYTLSRVVAVTDACGNTQDYAQTVTVLDNVAPEITCPADTTISCNALITNTATVLDNCDAAPVLTWSDEPISGNCDWECTLQRTWKAVDACGNENSCVQTITLSSLTLLEEALSVDTDGDGVPNPLVLGLSHHKLTITPAAAHCIIGWMPSVGDSAMSLRTAQIIVDGTDCDMAPNPVNADGKAVNPLLEAGLKLSIRLRLDPMFGKTKLADLPQCRFHPILYQYMPPKPTVNDLLRLTNIALGNLIGPPHLQHLLRALSCINGTYEICQPEDNTSLSLGQGTQSGAVLSSATASWKVYPNPATGVVFADLRQWDGQTVELELLNASGQVMAIQRISASETPTEINVAAYPAGLYFLRVKTGNGVGETMRFVIH